MYEYIKKLQNKDEDSKKIALIGFMSISAIVVGLVWYASMQKRFIEVVVAKEKEKNQVSPFKMFQNSLSDTYNNVSASVGEIKSGKFLEQKEKKEKQVDLIVVEPTE